MKEAVRFELRPSSRSAFRGALIGIATLVASLAACTGGQQEADTVQAGATGATADASGAASVTAAAPTAAGNAFLDPDAATREQLLTIPGMSASIADAVVAGRPYQNMAALDRVLVRANLTEQQRDTVYTRLWKPIDLNTASGAEIMLIPGVGPRMRHEFEEYRPYRSIEQFRREIGKYVSPQEVARLERYVTIRGQGR
jgi:DNA uptake protein ComE-like DNA-binding protein